MADELIPSESEILLYTTPSGAVRVEVFYQAETFWLSQRRMAELFAVEQPSLQEDLCFRGVSREGNGSKNSNSSK
ncbi:MAG TPA: hypothetical protein VGL53_06335 [Bryobacteraceae bacterium]|jgi:hypothetical protein